MNTSGSGDKLTELFFSLFLVGMIGLIIVALGILALIGIDETLRVRKDCGTEYHRDKHPATCYVLTLL